MVFERKIIFQAKMHRLQIEDACSRMTFENWLCSVQNHLDRALSEKKLVSVRLLDMVNCFCLRVVGALSTPEVRVQREVPPPAAHRAAPQQLPRRQEPHHLQQRVVRERGKLHLCKESENIGSAISGMVQPCLLNRGHY